MISTIHCGVSGYFDHTVSPNDEERRKGYITRHKANEHCSDPVSVGALSRYIYMLWEKPSLATLPLHNMLNMFRLTKY